MFHGRRSKSAVTKSGRNFVESYQTPHKTCRPARLSRRSRARARTITQFSARAYTTLAQELSSLLNSVRGLYMRQPSESNRGRPARYAREQLLRVDSVLRDILARETHISVRSFIGQYLPILDFPRDV